MARRPRVSGNPGFSTFRLSDRLRELTEERRITVEDRRRIEDIFIDRRRDIDDFIIIPDPHRPVPGAITESIKPRDLSSLILDASRQVEVSHANALHSVTGKVMERLKEQAPGTLPGIAVAEGKQGADLPVQTSAFGELVKLAAMRMSEGAQSVIWDDGVNQLVVHAGRVKVRLTEGHIEVTIPTEAHKLKANMVVPFATGSKERVAGLVMSTLERPAGNPVVARIWGDALIALAHGAVLGAAESLAGASGRDKQNNRLIPRAISAHKGQISIQSQARFALKGRDQ